MERTEQPMRSMIDEVRDRMSKSAERLAQDINEVMDSVVIRTTDDYGALMARLIGVFGRNGYAITDTYQTKKSIRIRLYGNYCTAFITAIRERIPSAYGMPRSITADARNEFVKLYVSLYGQTVAEKHFFHIIKKSDRYLPPFTGAGPVWDNAEAFKAALKKKDERMYGHYGRSVSEHVHIVKGKDAFRLYKENGKDMLSLIHRKSGYENVKAGDVLSVQFEHSEKKASPPYDGATPAHFRTLNVVIEISGKLPIYVKYSYEEDALRRELRNNKERKLLTHGMYIPESLCNKNVPWMCAVPILGSRKQRLSDKVYPFVAGYFMAVSDPVYGFTYALTDAEGKFLVNGYSYDEDMPRSSGGFMAAMVEKHGLFMDCRPVRFPINSEVRASGRRSVYYVPLNILSAATKRPAVEDVERIDGKEWDMLRDLSLPTEEEWNAERHITTDGTHVYICGGNHADGYVWDVISMEKGELLLRNGGGMEKMVFKYYAGGSITATAYSDSGNEMPLSLSKGAAKDINTVMETLKWKYDSSFAPQ